MTKLILKNKEEIIIADSSAIGAILVDTGTMEEIAIVWGKLTIANLDEVTIEQNGKVIGIYQNLICPKIISVEKIDTMEYQTTFGIRPMTDIELLEKKVAILEASQDDQDSAIEEMASEIWGG